MMTDKVREFVGRNTRAVLTTFRASGAAQMSVVLVGLYGDGPAFSTPADRAKLHNLKRDPRCSLLVSKDDWWGYLVLEGHARIISSDNTDAEELRLALREVFRGASGGEEHPNWEEFDQAMVDERRVVIVVEPERVYGTA